MDYSTISLLSLLFGFAQFTCAFADATVTQFVTVSSPTPTGQSAQITPTSAIVDTDAGASGTSDSSIGLSKGGLIAVVVVVALVAIFGIVSTILFFVAKRRQWNIRASIARASRRLTRRSGATRLDDRSQPRYGKPTVIDVPASRSGVKAVRPPGQKRPLVVDVRDVEKGNVSAGQTDQTGSNESTKANPWLSKMRGNDWK